MADQDNSDKKALAATDSVRELLNMDSTSKPKHAHGDPVQSTEAGQLPPDLPFLETIEETPEEVKENLQENLQPAPQAPKIQAHPVEQIIGPAKDKGNELYAFFLWAAKNVLPYIVIFAIGLGLYFFYFSEFTFTNWFNSNNITLEKVETGNKDLEKLKKDEAGEYMNWMGQFFFTVNDEAIIAMDTDVSGNGLTNFEKYLLNLNPKVYSTRGSNDPDGQLVIENINPWTGKPFSDAQRELVDKYINKELISNRITAAALTRGITKFAEYVSTDSPYYVAPEQLREIQNNNPSISSPELVSNQSAYQAAQQAGGGANLNPNSDINEAVQGRLEIPSKNVSVPLIWTQNVSDFDKDLKSGVVHYPGTVMPGQIGTSYISGHSSGYAWDRSPYKQIFAILGQVTDGTSFSITVTQKDGKLIKYHYVVERRGEYLPTDQAQFINTADSVVALSTCWPIGSTAKRLVLFGKLSQTESL